MDKLTDAELVERVAREVLGCNVTGDWGTSGKIICKTPPIGIQFDPIHDMNDLFMVLEKCDSYMILRDGETGRYTVTVMGDKNAVVTSETLPRAVLEAALKAKGETK